jgi:GNAT superfamily N-acetyltransferase
MRTLIRKLLLTVAFFPMSFAVVARNWWCGRRIRPFAVARFDAFVVEPLSRESLPAVHDLYAGLNGGTRIGLQNRAILRLLGSRLCLVARGIDGKQVLGIVIYYFNSRDRRENTVHEGYIGLRESARGAGLGTFMRRHALENFARSSLSGVSSRISVGNLPSLKGNEKLGFVAVETYFDRAMGDERHYLICDLGLYRESINESHGVICR